jgi:hypothetical protein
VLSTAAYAEAPANDGSTGPVPVNTSLVDVATQALKSAQKEFDAYVEARRKEFSESQLYVAAKKAVDDASAELETLEAPLREQLKASDPRYAQALQDIVPAREKLAEAVNAKKAEDIAFRRASVQYFEGVISKAESPVFEKSEPVKAAMKKLKEATEKLTAMQKRFNDALDADPDYQALGKALNNAKSRLAVARSKGR